MKHFYMLMLASLILGNAEINAQTGPNLLGAKGTFSAPFVTPNTQASNCTGTGTKSYSPIDNIGNPLNTLTGIGTAQPASGYDYTAVSGGLQPEFTYTLIKNIGDGNGGNCIKGDWRGKDHTGDGGWFMAVNGAPNNTKSPIFYKITSISVCPGTKYEFSAWVINMLPKSSQYAQPGSEPNISFKVTSSAGSVVIATSGPISYTNTFNKWVKVSGTYTAPSTVSTVDLEVINATAVAWGNDLGLDDISFNVVQSNIAVSGAPNALCEGQSTDVIFTVNDATQTNTWYKWQVSRDGGAHYTDSTAPAQHTFDGNSYDLTLNFTNVSTEMNGNKYRLVVSTSPEGLENPGCTYVNEYTLLVTQCGAMPVTITHFDGRYNNGQVVLNWQTTQEINSNRFEILKSSNGQNFTVAGTVLSAGNSSTIKNYSFTDNQPANGQYVYYRLRQVDIDGKSAMTDVIKVTVGNTSSLRVFPNPFTSGFTASFTANKNADATLIIRNVIGQPVMQRTIKTIKGNNSVNVTNLATLSTGVYYLTIVNDDVNYNTKIQKQ